MNETICTSAPDFELLTIPALSRNVLKQSERKTWGDIAAGRFGPDVLHLGRCVRVRADELRAWLAAGAPSREEWLKVRGDRWSAGAER